MSGAAGMGFNCKSLFTAALTSPHSVTVLVINSAGMFGNTARKFSICRLLALELQTPEGVRSLSSSSVLSSAMGIIDKDRELPDGWQEDELFAALLENRVVDLRVVEQETLEGVRALPSTSMLSSALEDVDNV